MKLATKIIFGFGLILFLIFILVLINKRFSSYLQGDLEYVSQSEETLKNSSALQKLMEKMQSGFRGFLLAGDESFLETYYLASSQFDNLYRSGNRLVQQDDLQRQRYDQIGRLIGKWKLEHAQPLIIAKREALQNPAKQRTYDNLFRKDFSEGNGKASLDSARLLFQAFDEQEFNQREKHRIELALSQYRSENISLILACFILLIGISVMVVITRQISSRMNYMISMAERIAKGEFDITILDTGNDEMSRLAAALNRMNSSLKESFSALQKSNKDLALSNKDLENFAYVASHDLKEPVRMVSNYTQLLAMRYSDKVDAEGTEYINFAVEGSHRIKNLLDDLLEYVKLTQMEMHHSIVDTNAILSKVVNDMSGRIKECNAELQLTELPAVQGDAQHIDHLFRNLLDNALKFNCKNNVRIVIDAAKQRDMWVFSVQDNGIGIEQQYENKIFTIFQRLHERGQYEGNGIGLTICKKIVELHGGRIWFRSSPNKGTTFYFTLPAAGKKNEQQHAA